MQVSLPVNDEMPSQSEWGRPSRVSNYDHQINMNATDVSAHEDYQAPLSISI